MPASLGELAVRFGCELRGDPDTRIERVGTLANAGDHALAFLANPRYRAQLAATRAAAVVLNEASAADARTAVLVCDNPYATYARIATTLYPVAPPKAGVHASALVAGSARVDPSAQIGPFCSVGEHVEIGARAVLGPHCCIAAGARLAEDVRLVAHVTVGTHVHIGARTVVHPGVVIGADGFGFAPEDGAWVKVPQVGTVRIGADVEIGANTTIDRGAIDDTVIEEGVKLDNLIMIAHNVHIGAHCVLAACTGVSGSTVIGKRCMIGGGTGFAGHISIADDVTITGFSMVTNSVTRPGIYSSGIPLEENHIWRRMVARLRRIGLLESRVRELERAAGLKPDQEEDHE
jgi:UDP-3-O-[3-hydroxymyristoyl] glucosamine N-acyltransferase